MDNVAEIDADAQKHPTLGRNIEVALRHALLNGNRAFDRAHGAGELRHDAVARDVYYSAAVLGDEREDHRLVRFEIAHRLFFVAPHEARVARHVRGQDGRETALVRMAPLRCLGNHVFYRATLWCGPSRKQPTAACGSLCRTDALTQP
jgi:hypothetical protein